MHHDGPAEEHQQQRNLVLILARQFAAQLDGFSHQYLVTTQYTFRAGTAGETRKQRTVRRFDRRLLHARFGLLLMDDATTAPIPFPPTPVLFFTEFFNPGNESRLIEGWNFEFFHVEWF